MEKRRREEGRGGERGGEDGRRGKLRDAVGYEQNLATLNSYLIRPDNHYYLFKLSVRGRG